MSSEMQPDKLIRMVSCDIRVIYYMLSPLKRRERRLGCWYTGRSNRHAQVGHYTILDVFDPPVDENRNIVRSKGGVVLNIKFKAKGHDLDCG